MPRNMAQIKKSRSTNWNENEKKVLKMLILERAEVLENKDTTTKTTQLKKHAWGEVLSRFNSFGPIIRDIPQLQNQWRNMKNRAKKSKFEYRSAPKKTDGGSPPPSPPPPSLPPPSPPPPSPPLDPLEYKEIIHNKQCCPNDHEHELFLLKKKAREQSIQHQKEEHEYKIKYEREMHERRMNILALEEEYWKNKTSIM